MILLAVTKSKEEARRVGEKLGLVLPSFIDVSEDGFKRLFLSMYRSMVINDGKPSNDDIVIYLNKEEAEKDKELEACLKKMCSFSDLKYILHKQ